MEGVAQRRSLKPARTGGFAGLLDRATLQVGQSVARRQACVFQFEGIHATSGAWVYWIVRAESFALEVLDGREPTWARAPSTTGTWHVPRHTALGSP